MRRVCILAACGLALLLTACGKSDNSGHSVSSSGGSIPCTSQAGAQGSCTSPQALSGDPAAPETNTGWVDTTPSFYRFPTIPGGYYRVGLSGFSADVDLFVFDRSGFQDSGLACVSARSSTAPESCVARARGAEMFVGVLSNGGSYQSFQLSRQPIAAPESVGTEDDPYDLGYTPATFTGSVDGGASFFKVTVAASGTYTVSLKQMDGDADLYVSSEPFSTASADATTSGASCTSLNYYTADESCQITVTGDTLYIGVDGSYAPAGATFVLTVEKTGGTYTDEGTAEDPIKLDLGETRDGEVGTESFYWAQTEPGHIYHVTTGGFVNVAVHDDDASFASTSVVCTSCYFQASGNAVYFRVVSWAWPQKTSIKVEELPLDAPVPDPGGSMPTPLYLARGVAVYTGSIDVVKLGSSASGHAAFEFRSVPGTYYRMVVDPMGAEVSATPFFSSGRGGCAYSLDHPGLLYCIVEATQATTGLHVDAHSAAPLVAQVGLSIEQIATPFFQGTQAEPFDLGEASGSFTGSVSNKGTSYYRLRAVPGVTYSIKATSTEVSGVPSGITGGNNPTDSQVQGYISDGAGQFLGSTCCIFTPGTDSILLALSPWSVAGGPVQIVVTPNDGTYPAEGIVGGPVVLDPMGDSHEGTVSVDHSSYVFQSVKDQLYGVKITDPTNPGVRATTPGMYNYTCAAREGVECRFYGTGGPIAINVTGGPAAFTLDLYPTQLPPNEGTAIDPMLLTLPVAHRGTVGYEESYYKVELDPTVRYQWWVSVIDGGAYGWFYGGSPGQVINCGWVAKPCSVSGRSALYVYVDGDYLGANFTLYVQKQQ